MALVGALTLRYTLFFKITNIIIVYPKKKKIPVRLGFRDVRTFIIAKVWLNF